MTPDDMRALRAQGHTFADIAKRAGVSRQCVHYQCTGGRSTGVGPGRTKNYVLRGKRVSLADLARELEVNPGTVARRIVTRGLNPLNLKLKELK